MTVVVEKTEVEKLAEQTAAINDSFASFATTFGTDPVVDQTAVSAPVTHAAATTATMSQASALSFFSNINSKATIYVPTGTSATVITIPEVIAPAAAPTAAEANSIFASMFSGSGFGGGSLFDAFGGW